MFVPQKQSSLLPTKSIQGKRLQNEQEMGFFKKTQQVEDKIAEQNKIILKTNQKLMDQMSSSECCDSQCSGESQSDLSDYNKDIPLQFEQNILGYKQTLQQQQFFQPVQQQQQHYKSQNVAKKQRIQSSRSVTSLHQQQIVKKRQESLENIRNFQSFEPIIKEDPEIVSKRVDDLIKQNVKKFKIQEQSLKIQKEIERQQKNEQKQKAIMLSEKTRLENLKKTSKHKQKNFKSQPWGLNQQKFDQKPPEKTEFIKVKPVVNLNEIFGEINKKFQVMEELYSQNLHNERGSKIGMEELEQFKEKTLERSKQLLKLKQSEKELAQEKEERKKLSLLKIQQDAKEKIMNAKKINFVPPENGFNLFIDDDNNIKTKLVIQEQTESKETKIPQKSIQQKNDNQLSKTQLKKQQKNIQFQDYDKKKYKQQQSIINNNLQQQSIIDNNLQQQSIIKNHSQQQQQSIIDNNLQQQQSIINNNLQQQQQLQQIDQNIYNMSPQDFLQEHFLIKECLNPFPQELVLKELKQESLKSQIKYDIQQEILMQKKMEIIEKQEKKPQNHLKQLEWNECFSLRNEQNHHDSYDSEEKLDHDLMQAQEDPIKNLLMDLGDFNRLNDDSLLEFERQEKLIQSQIPERPEKKIGLSLFLSQKETDFRNLIQNQKNTKYNDDDEKITYLSDVSNDDSPFYLQQKDFDPNFEGSLAQIFSLSPEEIMKLDQLILE